MANDSDFVAAAMADMSRLEGYCQQSFTRIVAIPRLGDDLTMGRRVETVRLILVLVRCLLGLCTHHICPSGQRGTGRETFQLQVSLRDPSSIPDQNNLPRGLLDVSIGLHLVSSTAIKGIPAAWKTVKMA